jgi:hypothetical protein
VTASVDPVLAPPVVDRLLGDAEILGDLCHAAAQTMRHLGCW